MTGHILRKVRPWYEDWQREIFFLFHIRIAALFLRKLLENVMSLFFFLIAVSFLFDAVLLSALTMVWASHQYTDSPSLLSLPPSRMPALCVITEHPAEVPVPYSSFPLAVYFTHGHVYISLPFFPFVPPVPSPMCLHLRSLHRHLCSRPANSFTCSLILGPPYMNYYAIFALGFREKFPNSMASRMVYTYRW